MATEKLTRKEACKRLGGMPERTFARLVSEGLPRKGDGTAARFPWPEIWHWYVDRERRAAAEAAKRPLPADLAEAELRIAQAKANRAELELAEMRGELMTVPQFESQLGDAFERVASKLKNLPRTVALRVTATSIAERETQVRPLVDEVLGELAKAEDVPRPPGGGVSAVLAQLPPLAARLVRAASLEVEPLGDDRYRVSGGSAERLVGPTGCSCPDARIRGRACKHALAAALLEADPALRAAIAELARAVKELDGELFAGQPIQP